MLKSLVLLVLIFTGSAVAADNSMSQSVEEGPQYMRLLTREGMKDGLFIVAKTHARAPKAKVAVKDYDGTMECYSWFDAILSSMWHGVEYEVSSCTDGQEFRWKGPTSEGDIAWETTGLVDVLDVNGNHRGNCTLGRAYWIRETPGGWLVSPTSITRPILCNLKG
ncbi:MAG TPA: hypothetical protein VFS75_02760 [Candidatus Paceibacterota bacterium]|nr:hypothetical protein [Candidatus Paceibacterota bacterium]